LALSACGSSDEISSGYQGIVEYNERTLAFEVSGRLATLEIEDGMLIAPGDVIGKLDDTLERLGRDGRASEAKAVRKQLVLLQAGVRTEDIRSLEAVLRSARSAEKLAKRTYQRESDLAAKGIGRGADLDNATSARSRAIAYRQEAEQKLARARHGARLEEVEVAEARAEAAEAAVKAASARIDRHVLLSDHDGHILEVHREEGEFVGVGTPIVTIADLGRPYVDVFVPEGKIDEATLGKSASIRIDASDTSFSGQVEMIGRRTEFTPRFLFSERERPNLVIRVRVRAEDPEHHLRAGLPAFVTFAAAPEP